MANDQMQQLKEQANWHWRNTMRPVRFFKFDVKAILPFCFTLFYLRLSTLILCTLNLFLFWTLEKKGLTADAALRSIRGFLFGNYRPGLPKFRYRRLKDFGR